MRNTLKRCLPASVILLLVAALVLGLPLAKHVALAAEPGKEDGKIDPAAARAKLPELIAKYDASPLYRAVAAAVRPAVVEVRVSKKVDMGPSPDIDEFFRHFFEDQAVPNRPRVAPQPRGQEVLRGLGSGVVVDAEKGYVLTNAHVVAGADQVEVILADGRKLSTEWARTDSKTDLAVVKIAADKLVAAPMGDSDAMEVGDAVLAIGSPEGLPQTVTSGIISAKGRNTQDPNLYQSFLQTDAAINRGNSGGPLVNVRGEIIGINTAIVSRTGVNEGIGLCIPSNMAKYIMGQLIEKGKVIRGYLGVVIQNVGEKLARSYNLPGTQGALVSQVAPNSPAAKAGFQPEDFIVTVDGKPAVDVNSVRNTVAMTKPGKSIPVEIIRDGKRMTINATVEEQPAEVAGTEGPGGEGEQAPAPNKAVEALGLEVATLTPEMVQKYGFPAGTKGVIISSVDPASDAAEQGLREGMVIVKAQGKDVATAEQFNSIVSAKEAAQGVRLRVMDRKGTQILVFIAPQKPKAEKAK